MGSSALSFGKVIGGLSKTLGVVNQIIPIYKEAQPIINNAKNAFGIIKEFKNTATNKIINNTEKNIKPIKEKINAIKSANFSNYNGPTFFQ